jgi:hypothetical protein
MSNVQKFIDLIGQGENVHAQEALNDILSAKAFEALEQIKQDIAENLFTESEQLDELSEESSDYHPHGFTSDEEKRNHAKKVKKEHGVRVTWHPSKSGGSESLRYHGEPNAVNYASKDLTYKGPMHKEETEQLDEISLKTASKAYVERLKRDDQGAPSKNGDDMYHAHKAIDTINRISKQYGAHGVRKAEKRRQKADLDMDAKPAHLNK